MWAWAVVGGLGSFRQEEAFVSERLYPTLRLLLNSSDSLTLVREDELVEYFRSLVERCGDFDSGAAEEMLEWPVVLVDCALEGLVSIWLRTIVEM